MPPGNWLPDWRDASAYAFERLDRRGFAWEWLRRDPAYRQAAFADAGGLERGVSASYWGLADYEHPHFSAPFARPIWLAAIDHRVLIAEPCELESAVGRLDLAALDKFVTVVAKGDRVQVSLSDGWRHIRFDVVGWFDHRRPLALRWILPGLRRTGRHIDELGRLLSLVRLRRFSVRRWPRDRRARRWTLALRAHDAINRGAAHREIAGLLSLGGMSVERWRIDDPSLRLRVQRLVALGRSLTGPTFAQRFLSSEEG